MIAIWQALLLHSPARTVLLLALISGLIAESLTGCSSRSQIPDSLGARLVAQGFSSPDELVPSPDSTGRLFVVDQVGLIWIVADGKRLDKPFLDIRDRLVQLTPFYDERGLLGLAFHPQFAANGLFYVYYSAPLRAGLSSDTWDHTTHISQFKISAHDPDQADPFSERVVLAIDKPGYNFEGGGLAFGSDGYLYIGTGDSVRDPSAEAGRYAQDTYSLLGKILRIDVNAMDADAITDDYHIPAGNPFAHNGGLPEVFAYGFRNPYRIWFDQEPTTAGPRLFVADVGQAMMEEADLVVKGGNYGWPIQEGTTCFNSQQWNQPLPRCGRAGLANPILEYPHAGKASALIGGVVYRGSVLPELSGGILFGDWGRGPQSLFVAFPPLDGSDLWSIQHIPVRLPNSTSGQLLGIALDQDSKLYLLTKDPGMGPVGQTGKVYQIVPH
ncbi:MAG TPA: PQQ-dependent sugar dehydrogenase [Anaerolineales bacterium]|nr:PQQ-dependent sugar dehydrogenase [Anaerolineales bacterium]